MAPLTYTTYLGWWFKVDRKHVQVHHKISFFFALEWCTALKATVVHRICTVDIPHGPPPGYMTTGKNPTGPITSCLRECQLANVQIKTLSSFQCFGQCAPQQSCSQFGARRHITKHPSQTRDSDNKHKSSIQGSNHRTWSWLVMKCQPSSRLSWLVSCCSIAGVHSTVWIFAIMADVMRRPTLYNFQSSQSGFLRSSSSQMWLCSFTKMVCITLRPSHQLSLKPAMSILFWSRGRRPSSPILSCVTTTHTERHIRWQFTLTNEHV